MKPVPWSDTTIGLVISLLVLIFDLLMKSSYCHSYGVSCVGFAGQFDRSFISQLLPTVPNASQPTKLQSKYGNIIGAGLEVVQLIGR